MKKKRAFTVDNVAYDVFIPEDGIKRQGRVLDGDNVGRTKAGDMIRDIIGTYYNYEIQVDAKALSQEEYDRLYEVLSAPVDSHMLTVPYGQTTLSFKAYVSNVDDTLKKIDDDGNHWEGLSFSFTAMSPQRRP